MDAVCLRGRFLYIRQHPTRAYEIFGVESSMATQAAAAFPPSEKPHLQPPIDSRRLPNRRIPGPVHGFPCRRCRSTRSSRHATSGLPRRSKYRRLPSNYFHAPPLPGKARQSPLASIAEKSATMNCPAAQRLGGSVPQPLRHGIVERRQRIKIPAPHKLTRLRQVRHMVLGEFCNCTRRPLNRPVLMATQRNNRGDRLRELRLRSCVFLYRGLGELCQAPAPPSKARAIFRSAATPFIQRSVSSWFSAATASSTASGIVARRFAKSTAFPRRGVHPGLPAPPDLPHPIIRIPIFRRDNELGHDSQFCVRSPPRGA